MCVYVRACWRELGHVMPVALHLYFVHLLLSTIHWEGLCVQWQGCNVYQCVHAGVKLVTLCQWHCTCYASTCHGPQFTGKGCVSSGKATLGICAYMLA
mgnify:CR=1 FL=1